MRQVQKKKKKLGKKKKIYRNLDKVLANFDTVPTFIKINLQKIYVNISKEWGTSVRGSRDLLKFFIDPLAFNKKKTLMPKSIGISTVTIRLSKTNC